MFQNKATRESGHAANTHGRAAGPLRIPRLLLEAKEVWSSRNSAVQVLGRSFSADSESYSSPRVAIFCLAGPRAPPAPGPLRLL